MDAMLDSILKGGSQSDDVILVHDGIVPKASLLAVQALGIGNAPVLAPDKLSDRLDHGAPIGAILIDIDHPSTPMLNALQLADEHGRRHRIPVHVTASVDALDQLMAVADGDMTQWLCEPTLSDRIALLAVDLGQEAGQLRDISSDMDPVRLRRLADEVSRIAKVLANLSDHELPGTSRFSGMSDVQLTFRSEASDQFIAAMPKPEEIRTMLRLRRLREQFFDPSLFADPAWDMLLDLAAARLERTQVAVSSLCIAAAVPPTTALRWIKTMTDVGLFERCADPDDGRRIFIRLSDWALNAIARYFAAMHKIGGIAI